MSLICLLIGNLKNVLASSFTPRNIKWIDSWNKSVFEHFSSSANFEKFDEENISVDSNGKYRKKINCKSAKYGIDI